MNQKPLLKTIAVFLFFNLGLLSNDFVIAQGKYAPLEENFGYTVINSEGETINKKGVIKYYFQYGGVGARTNVSNTIGELLTFEQNDNKTMVIAISSIALNDEKDANKYIFKINPNDIPNHENVKIQDKQIQECSAKGQVCRGIRITFEALKNGGTFIQIPYTILLEGEYTNSIIVTSKITLDFSIFGLPEMKSEIDILIPPPETIDEETKFWQGTPKNLVGVFDYLKGYPNGNYLNKAKDIIYREEVKLWNKAFRKKSINGYQSYKDAFKRFPVYARHLKEAKRRQANLIELKRKRKEQEEAWSQAKVGNKIKSYRIYLGKYPQGSYAKKAKNQIAYLTPIKVIVEVKGDNIKYIKIKNARNPRYKDISLDKGLSFDHSLFLKDTILIVHYEGGGRYKILIEDDWGNKRESISFDNRLEAAMSLSEQDTSLFVFDIKKGQGPYNIEFVHEESGLTAWTRDSITSEGVVQVSYADFHNRGLAGKFKAFVWDRASWKPVIVATPMIIPPISGIFNAKFISLLVAGVLLIISAILIFVLQKRKENRQNYSLG